MALLGVFLAGLAMMASIAMATRLIIVCVVIAVAGCAISTQKSQEPFSPAFRRQLRGLVLIVGTVGGVALCFSRVAETSDIIWLAFLSWTAFTYLSLRIQFFGSSPPTAQ